MALTIEPSNRWDAHPTTPSRGPMLLNTNTSNPAKEAHGRKVLVTQFIGEVEVTVKRIFSLPDVGSYTFPVLTTSKLSLLPF